jgi:hypothetical protein
MMQQGTIQLSNMVQFNGPDDYPFICLPGIREYHDNPAHTGDSWLLHRGSGEGSLAFILNNIWKCGVEPLAMFQVQAQVQLQMPNILVTAPIQAFPE